MKVSQQARKLIQQFEGLSLTAYRCPAGVWTIGYGHTGKDVRQGMSISPARAEELFSADIAVVENFLTDVLSDDNISLRQGQFDAICSFAFNLGLTALVSSTLWRKLKVNPADSSIPAEFARWVYATQGGQKVKLRGLEARRNMEIELWNG